MECILCTTTLTTTFYNFSYYPNNCFLPYPNTFNTLSTPSTPLTITYTSNKFRRNLITPVAFSGEVKSESDVIILDVRGMACEGCVSSVKKILESQPQVSSVSVDLAKETAIIWPVAAAKAIPDWQTNLGENLAKILTSCGFESNIQRVT